MKAKRMMAGRMRLLSWPKRPGVLAATGAVVILPAMYLFIGGFVVHSIDDNTAFLPQSVETGASRAVEMAASLIDREIETHAWVANDPIFMPGAWIDNMPNFQQGVIYALSRFAIEMSDQLGRTRGTSQVDEDLEIAAGKLKISGKIWYFDGSSLLPVATAESQYKEAAAKLRAYNTRLASGGAILERRADNLERAIDRITKDLGSGSALIESRIDDHGLLPFDSKADDIFYANKGRLYGYYMILQELGKDFDNVIADREIGPAWRQMLDSLRLAAELQPMVVLNGDPDGQFAPNHLATQGFYLLRARAKLKEVGDILVK